MNVTRLSPSAANIVVPTIVGCALFMQTLDSTVIATALPVIARSMGQNPIRLNLAITSYLLSLAVFIPISGWVADRFGARTVFRAAIAVFTLGSIFCGLSSTLMELVLARVLQGFGGAMMVPVGRLVVLRIVPKSGLVDAMSWLTIPAVLGPVFGPPVGGFIVTYSSWRWIFFMNVPIAIMGVILVTLYIPDIREDEAVPLDFRGFVLTGLGLAGLVFGFETIGRGMLPAGLVTAVMTIGGLCAALYFLHSRRITNPIVDLKLMRIHTFAASVLGGGLARMGIGALPFLLAMLLQIVFGLTPFASGLITFTSAVGALTMKFTVSPIVRRFGFRSVLIGNGVISGLLLVSYAAFRPGFPTTLMIATLLAGGFFRSLQFTALNTVAYADITLPLMSGASTLSSMAQQLFLSLGVTVAALTLHVSLAFRGASTLSANDFAAAFVVIGILSLASTLFFVPLEYHAGAEVSGHQPAPALADDVIAQAD
ncbi:MAG TPA: MFS transporter [Candidatus Binataceae bacterium]|nr:MFS transporter [Candidatus Binataceae bacterium]